MRLILGASALVLLTGCSSTNVSELASALAADPNTAGIYLNLTTPIGMQQARVCRAAPGMKVTCNSEGMTVEPAPK